MARWTASAKWAEGPALDGQRDMPLALRLSEGLGHTSRYPFAHVFKIRLLVGNVLLDMYRETANFAEKLFLCCNV